MKLPLRAGRRSWRAWPGRWSAVNRSDRCLERVGHLGGRPPEHVGQQQRTGVRFCRLLVTESPRCERECPAAIGPTGRSCTSGCSVHHNRAPYGMLTQLHPVSRKMHAWSAAQNPLHSGRLASPQAVARHSHAPPDATAEQWPPSPQVPVHWWVELEKVQPELLEVVVVIPPRVLVVVVVPRGQAVSPSCRQIRRTFRRH